ncbi:hypothetical protein RRG08_041738 [Elysia crispata]|uniref:Uncharacterized protein n=1 Tax=Elysia crispata TaxID=231223 RepID=A0AAE0YZ43_9GAST|nr:hypothetical protein RRG08_041738 [Elysia crispata]
MPREFEQSLTEGPSDNNEGIVRSVTHPARHPVSSQDNSPSLTFLYCAASHSRSFKEQHHGGDGHLLELGLLIGGVFARPDFCTLGNRPSSNARNE